MSIKTKLLRFSIIFSTRNILCNTFKTNKQNYYCIKYYNFLKEMNINKLFK